MINASLFAANCLCRTQERKTPSHHEASWETEHGRFVVAVGGQGCQWSSLMFAVCLQRHGSDKCRAMQETLCWYLPVKGANVVLHVSQCHAHA